MKNAKLNATMSRPRATPSLKKPRELDRIRSTSFTNPRRKGMSAGKMWRKCEEPS